MKRLRAQYSRRIAKLIISKFKFIDESGINLGMTRLYGRARPGQRVVESVPSHSGTHLTLLAAIGLDGLSAAWVLEGALDGEAFKIYLTEVLCPTLRPGDVVLMDNLSAHKVAGVEEAITAVGARLEYLPPYSPDLNPIEKCWSKIKTALRAAKARTVEALIEALNDALLSISEEDIKAWFIHCGYTVH